MASSRLTAFTLSFALFASVAAFGAGCATETDVASDDAQEQDLTASGSRLVGQWKLAASTQGEFTSLTLNADKSYSAALTDSSTRSGAWKARTYRSGTRLYLDVDGKSKRYDVTLDGQRLTLKDDKGNEQRLELDPCADVFCAATLKCVEGECVALEPVDPCEGVVCAATLTCVEGDCVPFEQAGEICGSIRCGSGEVCCNPLAEICTPPGYACIQ